MRKQRRADGWFSTDRRGADEPEANIMHELDGSRNNALHAATTAELASGYLQKLDYVQF